MKIARFYFASRLTKQYLSDTANLTAAILEYFNGTGISVFADYRYYPNQVVYHKVMDALTRYGQEAQPSA